MQYLRSLTFTVLFFSSTAFFAVCVIVLMWLPPERLYFIPRTWARVNFALLRVLCGLDYRVEGQEHLPTRPFTRHTVPSPHSASSAQPLERQVLSPGHSDAAHQSGAFSAQISAGSSAWHSASPRQPPRKLRQT